MKNFLPKILVALLVISHLALAGTAWAEVINLDANKLAAKAEISITPSQASFVEGSTFEVPILLNTKGRSMNSIELNIAYDPKKLMIVNPSVGKSIISMWADIPKYDNARGVASFVGSIPGGIVSDSSLIITITFQAKAVGTAEVRVLDTSVVLANDGVGTQAVLSTNRGVYNILPKPPGSINVYSDTHPFQDNWYNNNSPTLAWTRENGVVGYSYVLDDKPNTIPDNHNLTNDTSKSYQDLVDGLWYFHIKALKNGGAWGSTTHYILRVDTTPPAKFKPKVNYLLEGNNKRALVSFFTTDSMSGIGHYEIGVIDKSTVQNSSPVFVRADSPYQIPPASVNQSAVVIRAYDLAGNSLDIQVSVNMPGKFTNWLRSNMVALLIGLLLFIIIVIFTHYGWKHKLFKRLKIVLELLNVEKGESVSEVVKEVQDVIEPAEVPVKTKEVFSMPIESKPEIKPEIKPESKPEIKIEIQPESKPELRIEPKPEAKIELKSEPKLETKPDTKPETVVPESKPVPVSPESKPEPIKPEVSKVEIAKIAEATRVEIPKKDPKPFIKPYPQVNFSPLPKLDSSQKDSKSEEPKSQANNPKDVVIPEISKSEAKIEQPKEILSSNPEMKTETIKPEISRFDLRSVINTAIAPKIQPDKPITPYQGDNLIKDKLSKTVVSLQAVTDDHIDLNNPGSSK